MESADFRGEETPLVVENSPIQSRRKHTRDVHILSSAFLLIFLAYGAAQNLETSLNTVSLKFESWIENNCFHFFKIDLVDDLRLWFWVQEDDLGTISLGILYLSFTFFSLVASPVVQAMGSKNALLLGTTGYWLFIAANLKPTWYLLICLYTYLHA